MLKQLSLRNFKSWKEIKDMRLAPITGIWGTNSSGKSSILQFLLMLKQTTESADRNMVFELGTEHTYVKLGSPWDIIHKHKVPGEMGFGLTWKSPSFVKQINNEVINENNELQITVKANIIDKMKIIIDEIWHFYNSDKFINLILANSDQKKHKPKYNLNYSPDELIPNSPNGVDYSGLFGIYPFKFYGFPYELQVLYKKPRILLELQLELEYLFKRINYISHLREYPKREYPVSRSNTPSFLGLKAERTVDMLSVLEKSEEKIQPNPGESKISIFKYLARKMKEMGLIYDFRLVALTKRRDLYQIMVKQSKHSEEVLLPDVGFGISQVLPVLVLCYAAPRGSIILFEQPEIHLHPKIQSELADIFIDAVEKRDIQIIFESHSEHLLKRLQRRIADETIDKDDVAMYFTSYNKDEGCSEIEELNLDSLGNITNWPEDFFGDPMGEISKMMDAQIARKKRKNDE